MEGRRCLVGAIVVFSVLLVVWIAAALLLSSASAGSLPISLNLRSRLKADYRSDEVFGPLKVYRLSIVNDRLLDGGMSAEEAEAQSEAIESAFDQPVPTATALNFHGDAPYTATYTNISTSTSTSTPLPTNTPTATKKSAKKPTKKLTKTPISTEEEIAPAPSKNKDTATPTIAAPAGSLTPTSSPTPAPPLSGNGESLTESRGVKDATSSLGPPDGDYASVGTKPGSVLIIDLGGWAPVSGGTQLAVYEHYIDFAGCPGGIYQDQQVVSIGSGDPGDIQWTVVFVFGDDPGEEPNTCILSGDLYDTSAYLINLGSLVSDPFRWVRFQNYPIGDRRTSDEQVQVDAIKVLN
jgi:hypothetical protein